MKVPPSVRIALLILLMLAVYFLVARFGAPNQEKPRPSVYPTL